MKKKIFLVCSIFIFYHVVCITVNVIPSLFDIQTWYIDMESTFGNKSRIFLSKREKGGIHFELHDYRPEDKVKQKLTLLDKMCMRQKVKQTCFIGTKCFTLMEVPVLCNLCESI